jgi:hypothetical protein
LESILDDSLTGTGKKQMKTYTNQQTITYTILFVLLFTRFPVADFMLFLEKLLYPSAFSIDAESLRLLQNQSILFFYRYSFILVAMVIFVNKDNLEKLNIDQSFVLIFLYGGLAYNWNLAWHYSNWQLGLATVIMPLFIFILRIKGLLKFGDNKSNLMRIVLVIVIGFLLGVLFIGGSFNSRKIVWAIQSFLNVTPEVVVEEVMFRGMLWMFLKSQDFSDLKIVVLQAILFWLCHVNSLNSSVFFWVIVPITSVLLGLVVWKSKSITTSIIAHLLVNVLSDLVAFRNL